MARNAVQVVVAELDRFIDDVMKKLALDVVALLAAAPSDGGTPIDTGWASANWIPYIGVASGVPSGTRPENVTHGMNNASRAAQDAGVANVALNYKHDTNDTIVVSNSVPYIIDLNYVHTPGFVQVAVNRAVRQFRKTLRTESF